MAPIDLKKLYGPPINDLWQFLYQLRSSAAAEAGPAEGRLSILQKYTYWLAHGPQAWHPPSREADKLLEDSVNKTLDFGEEQVPVNAMLLPAAKAISSQLVRRQSYSTPLVLLIATSCLKFKVQGWGHLRFQTIRVGVRAQDLNQVQAYLALHRYLSSQAQPTTAVPEPEQVQAAAGSYLQQRIMLLSCIQAVLLYAQGQSPAENTATTCR